MIALDSRSGATVGAMTPYARRKDELFATLTGTVLEIGAGRGANFDRLPSRATWIGLEPDRRLRVRLARRVVAHGREPRVLAARAEAIPLPDSSVDAVVATVVLCSVTDPPWPSTARTSPASRSGDRRVAVPQLTPPAPHDRAVPANRDRQRPASPRRVACPLQRGETGTSTVCPRWSNRPSISD